VFELICGTSTRIRNQIIIPQLMMSALEVPQDMAYDSFSGWFHRLKMNPDKDESGTNRRN
jgi:hypothetical protein